MGSAPKGAGGAILVSSCACCCPLSLACLPFLVSSALPFCAPMPPAAWLPPLLRFFDVTQVGSAPRGSARGNCHPPGAMRLPPCCRQHRPPKGRPHLRPQKRKSGGSRAARGQRGAKGRARQAGKRERAQQAQPPPPPPWAQTPSPKCQCVKKHPLSTPPCRRATARLLTRATLTLSTAVIVPAHSRTTAARLLTRPPSPAPPPCLPR